MELSDRKLCNFTHFLSYFFKINSLELIWGQNPELPKNRSILHYLCLNGHVHLIKQLLAEIPQVDLNIGDLDGTPPIALALKKR